MKKIIQINTLFLTFIGATLIASCQSEELVQYEKGDGYIQLSSVELDKSVQTRATSETMAIKISNSDGTVFQQANDWTELQGQSFLVPAGNTYTIEAYSYGKTIEQGFDVAPYYSGSEELTVKANTAHTVDVVCGLAQSMVTVSYSESFKSHFSNYSATVTGNENLSLVFSATETRAAYVKANQPLQIALTLTPNGGEETSVTQNIVENALPAYRYNVKYDVNLEGSGDINVSVDQNRHEYEITLGIPLKPDGVSTTAIAGDASKVWGKFAYLEGQCTFVEPTSPVEFKYKKASEDIWQSTPAIKDSESNKYTAKVDNLDFGTEYQYKIVCGEAEGSTLSFITESFEEIPNLNFDTWTQNKKNWYANPVANCFEDEGAYWATGNDGVTSFLAGSNDPITVRTEDAVEGYAAEMHTITGITIVDAAAGNLFIGKYKTDMRKPVNSVTFGRPYTGARPTKLSGYYKYTSMPISNSGTIPGTLTTDECNIYLRLWDAEGNEIGFGEFVSNQTVDKYTPFEFDIEYSDPTKYPATITIVATSSHYGGEFSSSNKIIGQVGKGSTLWVDEFSLSYE